jgi:hypothetical protein
MASSSNRQTTMAKLNRERRIKEKRALKQEKKDARKQAAAEARGEIDDSAPSDDSADERLGD